MFDEYNKYAEMIKYERKKEKKRIEEEEKKALKSFCFKERSSIFSKKFWFVLAIVVCFFISLPFWIPIHIFAIIPPIISGIAVCFSLYALFVLINR